MKENGHVGPTKKKIKQNIKGKLSNGNDRGRRERERVMRFLFFYFSSSLLSQIYENLTVGFCRAKNEKCSTRRGLRVGTKNTGFHQEFR